jgi:hypothetical protein
MEKIYALPYRTLFRDVFGGHLFPLLQYLPMWKSNLKFSLNKQYAQFNIKSKNREKYFHQQKKRPSFVSLCLVYQDRQPENR